MCTIPECPPVGGYTPIPPIRFGYFCSTRSAALASIRASATFTRPSRLMSSIRPSLSLSMATSMASPYMCLDSFPRPAVFPPPSL